MHERIGTWVSLGSISFGWLAPIEQPLRIASLVVGIIVGAITIWKFAESKLKKGKNE